MNTDGVMWTDAAFGFAVLSPLLVLLGLFMYRLLLSQSDKRPKVQDSNRE